ncbi:MAG: glycosyltransferase family 39 protein, partial [Acholeplasmataceae bacterium]|nr:glycosyltransferase family 39 protein [Acholeplasmataceae bacterium]
MSYIFPLFPPLAIIIGWNIVRVSRERFPRRELALAIPSLIMFVLLSAGWFFGGQQLTEMSFGAIILAGITLLLAIGIGSTFLYFKDALLASWLHVAAGILTMVVVFTFMLPTVSGRFSAKTAADYYLANCDKGVTVHIDKFLRPGFMYYANVPGVEMKPETSDFADLFKTGGTKFIVVRGLEY